MATRNNIGKTIYFSATLPANNDEASLEALTWIQLEYPITLPQFGVTHATIDIPSLSGFTSGVKGAGSGVDTQGSCEIRESALAAGQDAFRAICDSVDGDIALKIGSGTGAITDSGLTLTEGDTVEYAVGFVHSYQEAQATNDSYESFLYNFKQNALTVKSTEPAP